jgi:hypothetical protein
MKSSLRTTPSKLLSYLNFAKKGLTGTDALLSLAPCPCHGIRSDQLGQISSWQEREMSKTKPHHGWPVMSSEKSCSVTREDTIRIVQRQGENLSKWGIPGTVTHSCNPSTWEVAAWGSYSLGYAARPYLKKPKPKPKNPMTEMELLVPTLPKVTKAKRS